MYSKPVLESTHFLVLRPNKTTGLLKPIGNRLSVIIIPSGYRITSYRVWHFQFPIHQAPPPVGQPQPIIQPPTQNFLEYPIYTLKTISMVVLSNLVTLVYQKIILSADKLILNLGQTNFDSMGVKISIVLPRSTYLVGSSLVSRDETTNRRALLVNVNRSCKSKVVRIWLYPMP